MKRFKRPMKAETLVENIADLDNVTINYPVIGSPKIDGIRCLKDDGKVLSSTLKPIPNKFTRNALAAVLPDGADGELTPASGDEDFQECSSSFMSHEGTPAFTYWMFDYVRTIADLAKPYVERLKDLRDFFDPDDEGNDSFALDEDGCSIRMVPTRLIRNRKELDAFLAKCLAMGFKEGIIIRSVGSPYKHGKSTLKEGYCLKIKYRVDSEAIVIGFEEQLHNTNAAKKDERGLTKRSHAQSGKVPAGTLGKLLVRDIKTGVEFEIGTGKGLTKEFRQEIWDNQRKFKGKIVKYSYQPAGTKDKPRQPSAYCEEGFLGFRHPDDMGFQE